MTNAKRFDSIKFDSMEVMPQGFLRIPAVATRTGVFSYINADGSVWRELRKPDDVFEAASMRTLANIPVTNDHPKEMVDPKNIFGLMVGYTSDAVEIVEKSYLQTYAIVTADEAIQAINKGKRELSCGYTCDIIAEKGEYNGEAYDCIQTNIVYNHLAIVDEGRAGPKARLRLDSNSRMLYDVTKDDSQKNKRSDQAMMVKVKIGEVEYDVPEEVKAEMDRLAAACSAAAELDKKDAPAIEEAKKTMDGLKAKLDHANSEVTRLTAEVAAKKTDAKDQPGFLKQYNERRRVENAAMKIVGAFKADASDLEIKKEVIKKHSPSANLDGQTDDYVSARFDAIYEGIEKDLTAGMGSQVNDIRADGAKDLVAEARAKSQAASKEAWKKPLTVAK